MDTGPITAAAVAEFLSMFDLIMVALGTGFFAVSILYAIACNNL